MNPKILLAAALMLAGITASGARPDGPQRVTGIVRDSASTEGLPYASVRAGAAAAVAGADGIFSIVVQPQADSLTVAMQGYRTKSVPLWTTSLNLYDIYLAPAPMQLREVVVNKQRYSKRNNPAVAFAERLRRSDRSTDPTRRPIYSYDRYERITIGLNDYDAGAPTGLNRRFDFLAEHVDTSAITGKPVLTLAVNERASEVGWRDGTRRELVTGLRQRGLDDVVEAGNMQTILSDAFREIDLFDNDIMLMRNSFVSPLSPLAPDCYRFYLVDTVKIEGTDCAVLAFYPRGHIGNGFAGHVYVSGDTTLNIRRVEMRNRTESTLNFIDALNIVQTFDVAPDGSRLKRTDDLALQMTVLPGTPSIYVGRHIEQTNHSFTTLPDSSLFASIGEVSVADGAMRRDDFFWDTQRLVPEAAGESKVDLLMSRLRANKVFYYGEKFVRRLFTGYWPTGDPSRFDFGPINTTASYNALEGLRLRAGGMTTAALSPRWFARGYVAYGFRDRRWKYSGELEYSFNKKEYHSREFPIHSVKLKHMYDLDRIGAQYLFTSADNFVLSLTRMPARLDTYRRLSQLEYVLELRNNFSLKASLEYVTQEPSRFVPFRTFAGEELRRFSQAALDVELRYAPGEKFYQMRTARFPINLDAPTFTLRHRFSPGGFLGSRYTVNRTEMSFSKRFWLSVAGKLDVAVGAGHVWSQAPFMELCIPNANLSYTIQPQSFALMSPMEFINTTYGSLFLTYHLEGLIFNHIPLVRKAGLREIVGFSALWGRRAAYATPSAARPDLLMFPADAPANSMHDGPYMEISAGLDNVLRCLRFDYYWRLSYRNVPYEIDRSGLRVALHLTF